MLEQDLALLEQLELVDQTVATIRRTAISIAALPSEAREEALFAADRAYADAMLCRGQDVAAAAKWVELVMTAVRLLVAQIDSSGGCYLNVPPL
jgi:hypothetical protein